MEQAKKNNDLASSINGIYIFFLLIGTAIRVPVSATATISLSEILLALTVFILPLLNRGGLIKLSKLEIKLLPIIMSIVTVFLLEILIHSSRILSVILLFEYLFIGIVLLLIYNRIHFSHKSYYKSMVLFSLYLGSSSLYFNVLNYETGKIASVLQFGSGNYSSAIMLILIPVIYFYLRERISRKTNILAYIGLLLMVISIVFSGSRSNIVVLLFQILFFLLFIQNSFIRKAKIALGVLLIALIGYNVVIMLNPELYFIIERYLFFFGDNASARNDILYSDIIRNNLKNQAMSLISENKFWGTGFARIPTSDIPIHNFVYEILLGLGYVGLLTYLIYAFYFLSLICRRIKHDNLMKKLYVMLIISFFLISWVHPFMTTGKEFTFIFWLNIIAFFNYAKNQKYKDEIDYR